MTLTRTYDPGGELVFDTTPVYDWNYESEYRINNNQGGSSSGKTYAILQVIFMRLLQRNQIATVVGQDIPNLKKGALRDFEERILEEIPAFKTFIKRSNKTDRIFYLTNGSRLEFTSYKDWQDAKSGKRDILFINEANGISYEIYKELAKRTSGKIFIDYNPNAKFWVHDNIIGRPDCVTFYSNFTHNPFAPEEMVNEIREYKGKDENAWRVYGLGKTGDVKGLVFPGVKIIEQFPEDASDIVYGLDFGFNDPTAVVRLGRYNRRIVGKELIYERGLTNQQIGERMREVGIPYDAEIYADSAEPKSIKEINEMGFKIKKVKKGPDSILFGVKLFKKLGLSITADSTNWRKEQGRYVWQQDKDGNQLEKPIDLFNHCWDAARYGGMMKWGKRGTGMKFARTG